jgi:hypothetical protein
MASDPQDNSFAHRKLPNFLKSQQDLRPSADSSTQVGRPGREFCIYPASLGYELQEELDFLSRRVMEPNVFFTARILAPAMPRIDDRSVRFALIRDENGSRSRMRLLMPFSIEKPGFAVGPSVLRVWANPFGPLGTPLVDAEQAAATIDDLLTALSAPDLRLPKVLVLPELRLDGPFAQLLKGVALARDLPLSISELHQRPMLQSTQYGDAYLRESMGAHHRRDIERQWRQLSQLGTLTYEVARQSDDVRLRLEEFLALEAKGWKGRKRTALVSDRFRAAFAREAIDNLSEVDGVRIHTLNLNGNAIASMIVFMTMGEAYTWKTCYDEDFAKYSPGKLLAARITDWHLDDLNIQRTDSCAIENHPLMSHMWKEREAMGTIIVGLSPNSDRDVRQVATQAHLYRNTRNLAKMLRDRVLNFGRKIQH